MYQNILVATDGTELGERAIEHAAKLAKALDAKLTIVTVTEPPPTFAGAEIGWTIPPEVYDQIQSGDEARAKKILSVASSVAAALGRSAIMVHVADQFPYAGILAAAKDIEADLIVMSSHGHRGLNRLILGSQAAKVLSLSATPVLIVK